MELVDIEIIDLVEKWFYMKIYTDNRQAILQNSNLFGNDAPNIFLETLKLLEMQETGIKYLRWEGESNSYIWLLEKKEDVLLIEVWSGESRLNQMYEGIEVLRERKELLFSVTTSFYCFVQSVKKAFQEYLFNDEKNDSEYNICVNMVNKLKGY